MARRQRLRLNLVQFDIRREHAKRGVNVIQVDHKLPHRRLMML
jgi:hypothetical protein